MKFRADYHFHPNLPRNTRRAHAKTKAIWKQFAQHSIRHVIISEHAYKNPRRAYEYMYAYKPPGYSCYPGIECISRERVDIVLFSDNPDIYMYTDAFKPFALTYEQLVTFATTTHNIYGFVTHPYAFGATAILNTMGNEAYRHYTDVLGAIEISNGSFDTLYAGIKKNVLGKIFCRYIKKMVLNSTIPRVDYPQKIQFLAVGSDAHHVESIGNCYEMDCHDGNFFQMMTNNHGIGTIVQPPKKFNTRLLAKTILTSLHEGTMKYAYTQR